METAKSNVSTKLNNMKSAYSEKGGGIKGIVSATFTGVKDTMNSLMSTANTLTGGKLDSIICDGEYQVIILLKDGIRTRSSDRCIVENQIGIQFQMVIATFEFATHQCVRRCCTVRNWRKRFTPVILDSVV